MESHLNSQPIQSIVFDFDNTLFDSEVKKQGMYHMAEVHGYTRDEAMALYDRARVAQEKIMMSLSSYIDVLREQLQQDQKPFLTGDVSQIIRDIKQGDGLLPGAKELLEYCRGKQLSLYLLSLGVREWQEEKVEQSGIDSFFPDGHIIYTDVLQEGKKRALQELFGSEFTGRGVALFNDKPKETIELLRSFSELTAFIRIELRDPRNRREAYDQLAEEFVGRTFLSEQLPDLKHQLQTLYEQC